MREIKLKIDGVEVKASPSSTILQAALSHDIYIPNLCDHKDLNPVGICRLCMVLTKNDNKPVVACKTKVEKGMEIITDSPELNKDRQIVLELLLANHSRDCTNCPKNNRCKLQEVSAFIGINENRLDKMRKNKPHIDNDNSSPFFILNHNKCILCGICVRTCNEVQAVDALQFGYRGYETIVTASLNVPLKESVCEACGECVVRCPVGALTEKRMKQASREVKTICPYCGVGCGIIAGIRGKEVVSVRGDEENPVNNGRLCVKGRFGYNWINHDERLKTPLIKINGKFREADWDEALSIISKKIEKYKGNKFALFASARCTNEENYLLQKFARVVMNSNHIDHCARLCHAPSVAGLANTLGSGAMTNSINEISDAKCIFAIGTNTTSTHPVIGLKIKEAKRNGCKIIVANPRGSDLERFADIYIQHKIGTDVPLLMGMCRVIIEENFADISFIKERCENFESFKESLVKFDLKTVSRITGVPRELIKKAALLYALNKHGGIFYAMGITQHAHGTDNVLAISNLALLTGNLGKKSAGVNPLRGQNNVQGACDMGALPDVFPGYQKIENKNSRQKFERAWKTPLNQDKGLSMTEIINAAYNKKIKAMYIVGENSLLSEPDLNHVSKAIKSLDFLVVQDIFMTETAQLADVVLPAASFAEKEGTFTNTERRVQRIRKAIDPPGESLPDWCIVTKIAKKMNFKGFDFQNSEQIFNEMTSLTPQYKGITYGRIESEGLIWPVKTKTHKGTPILYKEKFLTKTGRAKFMLLKYIPSKELPDNDFPFILTTERSLYHYHTSTMTGRVEGLNELCDKEYAEINPADAAALNLDSDDEVLVISRRGKVKAHIKISEKSPKGVVKMSFHFPESPTNMLTNPTTDPVAKIPELKACAVRIEKIMKGVKPQ